MRSWPGSCAMWSRRWVTAAVLSAHVLAALPALAQTPGEIPPAQQALAAVQEVRRLLDEGNVGEAIVKASEATELDPRLAAAWRARAVCHQLRGNDIEEDREFAIAYYSASLQLEEWEEARRQLRSLTQGGRYPRWVTEASLQYLPGSYERRTLSIRDERLGPDRQADLAVAVSTAHQYPERVPKQHAIYGDRFAGVVYGLVEEPDDPMKRLRMVARVFYPTDTLSITGHDYLAEASNTVAVLARLCACYRAYMGKSSWDRLARPVSLYLVEGPSLAPAGGARSDAAIYNADTPRSPEQWVADTCAAFGEMAMPLVGPLPGSPMWAGGDMGRALYSKWLALNSIDGVIPWGDEEVEMAGAGGPSAATALQAFMSQAPNDEMMLGPVEQPGQMAAGLVLYADSILGGSGMESFLVPGEELAPRNLLWRFAQILRDRDPGQVRVPAGLFITDGSNPDEAFDVGQADTASCFMLPECPVRYRVFLDEGEWSITLVGQSSGDADGATRLALLLDGGPRRQPVEMTLELRGGRRIVSGVLPPLRAGWYMLTLSHDSPGNTVELSSISFSERKPGGGF
jgi:hypothetical protein